MIYSRGYDSIRQVIAAQDLLFEAEDYGILNETDREIRSTQRAALGGDPASQRQYFRKLERTGREREFFANSLEAFHKAHEAKAATSARRAGRRARAAIIQHGQHLANVAHVVDHPVGRYLDPKRLGNHSNLLHAIQRVSVAPGDFKKEITHPAWSSSVSHVWYGRNATERHLHHGLTAHGLEPKTDSIRSALAVRRPS